MRAGSPEVWSLFLSTQKPTSQRRDPMADKYHHITITGLVVQEDGDSHPDSWSIGGVCNSLIQETVEVTSSPLKVQKKRAYTCSICGGRHSSRFCPHKDEGGHS
tara:strand:+ start:7455 stop:7766 length:312 start_codon:yes stop_codon:yes gene_type:complete